MSIVYVDDFLNSSLTPLSLYQLRISLGVEISETAFRNVISTLNTEFVSPRVAFSALWTTKELTIYYSTSDWQPVISQREIVSGLMDGFDYYFPSILYQESTGEIFGAVPLIPVKATEPRPLFSPEWIPEFFKDMKEEAKQVAEEVIDEIEKVTGWPRWAIHLKRKEKDNV